MDPLDETQPPAPSPGPGPGHLAEERIRALDAARSADDTCSLARASTDGEITIDFSTGVNATEYRRDGVAKDVQPAGSTKAQRFGNYELLEAIGKGGMGVVYKARQLGLNRIVALKRIRAGELAEGDQIQRFYAEAEAAAALDHSGIVPIHEVGEVGGQPFFSMGYVAGESLQQRLALGPLDPRDAARIVQQAAEATQYAHQHGIIHRDLKPGNILLDADGHPRVTDFGLAKRTSEDSGLTMSGQILGTPAYMPPEQARGQNERVGPRSDVYALGAVLYALVTGRPPFQAASFGETLRQVIDDDPASPRTLNPSIPIDLESIALKCLEKELERRYASAGDLAADLQRYLAGEPIRARPIGQTARAWRWCRRNRAQAGLMALVVLALTLGSVVSTWFAIASHRDAMRADEAASQASAARDETKQKLRESLLAQSQAGRFGGQIGRRFKGLRALSEAAEIRPGLDLRNEAIACMALVDLRVARQWDGCRGDLSETPGLLFDSKLERYARSDARGNISVRQVANDREIASLPGPGRPAYGLKFSPDSRLLAATYLVDGALIENQFILWRLDDGHKLLDLHGQVSHRSADFSPDGRHLAIGQNDRSIRLYSATTGEEVRRIADGVSPGNLCFRPDGRELAIAGNQPQILDVATGKVVRRLSIEGISGASPGGFVLAWHPHGELIAGNWGEQVCIWDSRTGALQRKFIGRDRGVMCDLAFNHRGDLLAGTAWGYVAALFDPYGGRKVLDLGAVDVRGWGPCVRFSGTTDQLGYNVAGKKLQLWEVAPGEECIQLVGTGGTAVEFHPNGRLIAVTDGAGARLWDLATRSPLEFLPLGPSHSVEFHPDGKSMFIGANSGVHRWPIRTTQAGERIQLEIGPPQKIWTTPQAVQNAALSADGALLAATSWSGYSILMGTDGRKPGLILSPHIRSSSIAISPDGRWVATGTWKGHGVKIWDGKTGKHLCDLPKNFFSARVEFSPDGRSLVTCEPSEYQFWEVGSWKPGLRIVRERNSDVTGSIAFSPDGQIAAVAITPNTVRLVELAGGQEIATLIPPDQQPLQGLCFNHDGTRLAVSATGVLQVWDLRAVRRQLAAMKLDWDMPEYKDVNDDPTTLAASPPRPMSVSLIHPIVAGVPGTPTASSVWNIEDFDAINAFDGAPDTRWNSRVNDAKGAWLAANWEQPVKVKTVVVREAFDRITGFQLFSFDEKTKAWRFLDGALESEVRALKGGSSSDNYQDPNRNPVIPIELPEEIETKGLRLYITSVVPMENGSVSIWEVETYDRLKWEQAKSRILAENSEQAKKYFSYAMGWWHRSAWPAALYYARLARETDSLMLQYWHSEALLLLAMGDEEGYSKHCQRALERFGTDRRYGGLMIPIAIAGSNQTTREQWSAIRQLAQQMADAQPERGIWDERLGAVCYRAGDFQSAAELLQRGLEKSTSIDYPQRWGNIESKLFLSMAHFRLNEPAEAKRWLAEAEQEVEHAPPTAPATLVRKLLLAQARDLMAAAGYGHTEAAQGEQPVPQAGPKLIAPQADAILSNGTVGSKTTRVWEFAWAEVPGATRYHLHVMHGKATRPLISTALVTNSSYREESNSFIPTSNALGWRWKVRARIGGAWTDWSEVRTFNVAPPEAANADAQRFERTAFAHANVGRWREAQGDYRRARLAQPQNVEYWYGDALTLLAAGDQSGYQEVCNEVLQQFGKSDAPTASRAAQICALGPAAVKAEEWTEVRAMAQRVVDSAPEDWNFLMRLGAVCYRAGDHSAAIDHLKRAARPSEAQAQPWIQLFLAMAYQQAQQPEEARRWLVLAEEQLEKHAKWRVHWGDRLLFQLTLAEARALVLAAPHKD